MLDKKLIPETIPFDFDENYESVKNLMDSLGYDTQEGSNTQQLMIAMSYLVSMLNANTAVNINEMLLPLARKRNTALLNARTLGYEAKHVLSYKYRLTVKFEDPGTHQINQYDEFTSGDNTYYYMGETITASQGQEITIEVIEGDLKRWVNNPNLITRLTEYNEDNVPVVDYFVDVPYTNVEENSIRVFLTQEQDSNGIPINLVEFPRLDNFIIDVDTDNKKGFIRLDNIEFGTPRIYFKLGSVGAILPAGTLVAVDLLISKGADGKASGDFNTDIGCEIVSSRISTNGSNEESLESIKKNAPLFRNSANRLVTKEDLRTFIDRDPRVGVTSVWDGNDEYPYRPGNIWYSSLPAHSERSHTASNNDTIWTLDKRSLVDDRENWYLTNDDINELEESMDGKGIPTLKRHHRNPVYMDFNYEIQVVRYNRSNTPAEWNKKIFDVIDDYFKGDEINPGVENFEFEYFQSNLDKRIDELLTDSTGFNIKLSTSISLTNFDILDEVVQYGAYSVNNSNQIRFHLGTPFEKYSSFNEQNEAIINTEYLPILTASLPGGSLTVDFLNSTSLIGRGRSYPVKIDSTVVGEYIVLCDLTDTIEVILHENPAVLTDGDLDSGILINVTYPTPNFKITRNTVPILKSVEFITS